MSNLSFEWDPKKATSNAAKHGVSFDEAQTVFSDPHALLIPDPDHSVVENRFVLMGMSANLRVLVVVHCLRKQGSVIRIISARRAGTNEKQPYLARLP